jgi:hypothetical protein
METKQQIDHLIELAIVQRAELKRLVEQLPILRTFLLEQINATIEDMEPQLRSDLIEFCDEKTNGKIEDIRNFFSEAKGEFAKKSESFFIELEKGVQARYAQLAAERALVSDFAEDARKGLEVAAQQEAAKIPGQVAELVKTELARFPRAGEIDQLRKEFAEPKGLNPRGKWSASETYNKLDLVAFNGDSFVSNIDKNTEKPGRNSKVWTLSAARGSSVGGGGITSLNDIYGTPAEGELLIGNGSSFVSNTLTAGTNVTITNTPGNITISATGGGGGSTETLTATVTNAESVAITKGQVVYVFGATGFRPSVKLAYNTSDATSAKTFGVVSDTSIAAGGVGTVTCVGVVAGLNLGTYTEGDTVYLGATPGTFTATKPYAPNHLVYVGIIERANAGNGELYVRIQNGYELDEIHDVLISSPTNGQVLGYDSATSLWKNSSTATLNKLNFPVATTSAVGITFGDFDLYRSFSSILSLTAGTLNGGVGVGYFSINSAGSQPLVLSANNVEGARITPTANVLIGGVTDISGSGGLKVFGTSAATGTTSGALQVVGGIGVGGAGFFGSTVQAGAGTSKAYVGSDGSNTGYIGTTTGAFPLDIRPNQTTTARFTTTGNLLVGTTTDMSGSGGLTVTGTAIASDVKLNTTDLSMRSVAADRAVRQQLAFDGTRGVTCSTPILSGDWTVAFVVNRQSAAVQQFLIGNDASGCFYLGFRTSGALYSGKALGSANTDMNLGNVVGVTQHIVVTKSGTTQTCYADGVSVGSITDSQTYTAAAATLFAADSAGSAALIGTGALIGFYNRALSAAEVAKLFRDGDPDRTDYNNASNTGLTGAAFTNFQYDTFTGASASGFTAAETGGQTCQANTGVVSGTFLGLAPIGARYLVTFTATLTSGAVPLVAMGKSGVGTASAFATVVAGANSHIFTLTSAFTAENSANSGGVVFQSAGNTSYAISGFSVVRLGLTLAPDAAQPGSSSLWYDTSGNSRTITLPANGVKWDTPTGGYSPQESSINGSLGFFARNNSTGNAAVAAIDLQNENGSFYGMGLRYFGNNFTQVNAYRANRGVLYGAFDLNFLSGQYKFWFGGAGAALDNSTAYEGFNIYGPSISTGTVTVAFTTPSSAFGTGALIVGGGASFGGALFSQQNSNSIVTGTNFANVNAGTAATLRHTLTAGTNTSTIEAYSNGHATFPGRLRFGTPNGQMDFVPSGVLGMSISASAVTVPVNLQVNSSSYITTGGFTQTQTGNEIRFSRNAFNYIGLDGGTSANLRFVGTTTTSGDTGILNLNNTQVAVLLTTNSTSKITGALVIGDGTNGGLGVSGNIVTGGNIGIGNVNPVVAYSSTGSLVGSGGNPQVRLSANGSAGWAFSTYGNTSATGQWSAGLNAGSQGYIITNDLDLSGTAALQILPTTLAATFGGALSATGTLTANAASNAFRIANSQTPASQTASGTQGQITWDASYLYVCTSTNNWGRSSLNWAGGGGGSSAQVDTYTTTGTVHTWTKPSGAKMVLIVCIGGGGGGGGGCGGAAGTARNGGAGGGGAARSEVWVVGADMPSTAYVIVGAGGAGGAGGSSASGVVGVAGGNSTVARNNTSPPTVGIIAFSGAGGGGGGGVSATAQGGGSGGGTAGAGSSNPSAANLAGGAPNGFSGVTVQVNGGAGGSGRASENDGGSAEWGGGGGGANRTGSDFAARSGGDSVHGAGAGGCGVGVSAANNSQSGSTGGTSGFYGSGAGSGTNGATGGVGTTGDSYTVTGRSGGGGGGGGSATAGTAGAGGAGGLGGGGGGGGGGGTTTGGAGGAGGNGVVIITTYF